MTWVYRNAYAVNQCRRADICAHRRPEAIGHRWGGKGRVWVHWGARWPIVGQRRVDGCNNVPYTDYIHVCIHETHAAYPMGPTCAWLTLLSLFDLPSVRRPILLALPKRLQFFGIRKCFPNLLAFVGTFVLKIVCAVTFIINTKYEARETWILLEAWAFFVFHFLLIMFLL